jgi:transcriptional regulator with XRE-family HTH domain
MSQTELAARAGVALATLNRIERWHFRVNESTARKLAEALGCEAGELFPYMREGQPQ